MTFSHADLGICIEFNENEVPVLIIEEPITLRSILEELIIQCGGSDGHFSIFSSNKQLSLSSQVAMILNPFMIDINDRKIHTKLYNSIETHIRENLIDETQYLTSEIIKYLDKALFHEPYDIRYDLGLSITGLLKLFNVCIEEEGLNLLERLISYMRVLSSLCGIYVFIFYNLKDFFTECELKQFYEFTFYSKLNIVLIESAERYRLSCEKITIIDNDKCMIQF